VKRILVVCTGNLCRSPMVMALLQARLARDDDRRDWQVASAGVWAVEGASASTHGIEEMAERGIDLSRHRARPVSRQLVEAADLVLVMTQHHAEALEAAFPGQACKVHLLSEMVGRRYDIQDPYGGARSEYTCVARELEQLIEDGYPRIVALAEGGRAD